MNDFSFSVKLDVTTDGSGDGVGTGTKPVNALLYKIVWVDGDLANSHTAVLTALRPDSAVTETLWSTTAGDTDNDASFYPRVAETDAAADATSTYGLILVTGIPVITVAAGGDTKSGSCILYFVS